MRLATFTLLAAVMLTLPVTQADTIKVPADQPTIQAGIDAAADGDIVLVAPGTYVENIDFIGKAITVTSQDGPAFTTIDGNQSGSVVSFTNNEEADSVLQGFTITNGSGVDGGGVRCESSRPTPHNDMIISNFATQGGGMHNQYANPILKNRTLSGNTSSVDGGGMHNHYDSDAVVSDSLFSGNSAGMGGGMYNIGSPTLTRCTFIDNQSGTGAGISNDGGDPVVTDCEFIGNTASFVGGGMLNLLTSSAMVTNCTFKDNSAEEGAGMYTDLSEPTVINCTFCSNIAQFHGGAMFNDDANSMTVTNCILWNNTPDEIKNGPGTTPTVTYSCIKDGYWGTGNIDLNPRFADEANGDFHLTYPSGCRNAGDKSVVKEPGDFEGDPRIAFGTVDMGVDEFYQHLYITGDATPGGAIQGKLVGLPGTSPVGLFLGSAVLDPPIPTAWGKFYIKAPWFLIPLVPIPGNGVLVLPATIPATPLAPYDLPMQALIGLNPDSLTNLEVLEVR